MRKILIANENQFVQEITRKQNDPEWKNIKCIQTCIKSKNGIGINYYIKFRLMIPVILAKGGDLEQYMKYDYRAIGREYE